VQDTLTLNSLPLFPLGTALFPGGLLPLRVFEVRYLDMIGRCQQAGAPFGVVTLTEGDEVRRPARSAERFADVGTLARIVDLQRPQPGLLLVRCEGLQRFVVRRSETLRHGLWVADVALLRDDPPVPVPPDLQPVSQALRTVLQTLQSRKAAAGFFAGDARYDEAGWLANRWCELLPAPPALKQRLMALDNPLVRLELVNDLLQQTGILRG
jgi:hypothetical protein